MDRSSTIKDCESPFRRGVQSITLLWKTSLSEYEPKSEFSKWLDYETKTDAEEKAEHWSKSKSKEAKESKQYGLKEEETKARLALLEARALR